MRLFPRSPRLLLLLIGMLAGCAHQAPLKPVAQVDLDRYMGVWHVIGNIPYFAERGKVQTADEYRRLPDGRIAVTFHYRKAFDQPEKTWQGVGWLPDPADAAQWKVQLLWPFRSDYVILALTPDYRAVLVGLPSRKLLWIMAREPQLADADYQRMLQAAAAQGYPVDQVRKVPQRPQDLGQPGFQ